MGSTDVQLGFAVLCDESGVIRRLIRDELGVFDVTVGRSLVDWIDVGSRDKALWFLTTLRAQNAAFGWEINVLIQGRITPLHFAGSVTDQGLLIIAARSRNGIARLYEEFMQINNEQANALRAALKDRSVFLRDQAERDATLYDELTRLNNELSNTQRELAKKNAELERLDREKNQFLGMAAHDLRSPLGIILGYSQFLLDDASVALTPEQLDFLSIIQTRSEFMLHLIDDLLDITRIESGQLDLDVQPTDLVVLVRRNVTLTALLAEKKGIRLAFESERDIPKMMVDSPKIEQVLNNLISNAVKFSPSGTCVEVHLARREHEIVLSVRDQGPGIPAEELTKLFKPFQKTSVRSTGGEKSTGLGLAIVRKIVQGHRGRIWVESEVGRGSTFLVALPFEIERENEPT